MLLQAIDTKGTWLELMKELETLSAYKDTLERFLVHGNNVIVNGNTQHQSLLCNAVLFWYSLQHTKGTPLRICSQNTRHIQQINLNNELP